MHCSSLDNSSENYNTYMSLMYAYPTRALFMSLTVHLARHACASQSLHDALLYTPEVPYGFVESAWKYFTAYIKGYVQSPMLTSCLYSYIYETILATFKTGISVYIYKL